MQRLFPAVIPERESRWRDFSVGIFVSTDLRCIDEYSGSF